MAPVETSLSRAACGPSVICPSARAPTPPPAYTLTPATQGPNVGDAAASKRRIAEGPDGAAEVACLQDMVRSTSDDAPL